MPLSEFQIIERFFTRATGGGDSVELGVGDDAAVLRGSPESDLAVAVDTLVSGVHFPVGFPAVDLGYRALAVNLSDLAAMGAKPIASTLALTLAEVDEDWLQGFADGFFLSADHHDVALIGGDTTSGPLSVTVQVLGHLPSGKRLSRTGARVGDAVYVSGSTGDAAAWLRLCADPALTCAEEDREYLRQRFSRPQPRIDLGRELLPLASAAIDVSDGLLADLEKLAKASGVGAVIELERVPLSGALRKCFSNFSKDALEVALTGGDDYELCFTMATEHERQLVTGAKRDCVVHRVGEIVADEGVVCLKAGAEVEFESAGFDHFRPAE